MIFPDHQNPSAQFKKLAVISPREIALLDRPKDILEREEALEAIIQKNYLETEQDLLATIEKDKIVDNKQAAVYKLGKIGTERAIAALLDVVQKEKQAKLPGKLDDPEDFSVKLDIYSSYDFEKNQKEIDLAYLAVIALGELLTRVPEEINQKTLGKLLANLNVIVHTKVRWQILQIFSYYAFQHPEACPTFQLLLKQNKSPIIKEIAAEALGALRCREALPLLFEVFRDGQELNVREACAESIVRISDRTPPFIADLIALGRETTIWQIRALVAWILGELKNEEAIPYLQELANNRRGGSEVWVRDAGKKALEKVRG